MVGRLIEQQNIGSLKDGTTQSQLHLPTTRKGTDLARNHDRCEAELVETLLDLVLAGGDASLNKLLHSPVNSSHFSVSGVQVVLNEDSLDLTLLGETLDLLVVDGAHQRRLARSVGTAKTITTTALEAEVSLVKKNLGTVGKRECAVAKILSIVIILFLGSIVLETGRGTLPEGIDNVLGIILANEDSNERFDGTSPGSRLGLPLIYELATNSRDVFSDSRQLLNNSGMLARDGSLEMSKNSGNVTIMSDLGDLAILDVTDAGNGLESLLSLVTGLGISQVFEVLLETWHHLRQEGGDDVGVVDKLAHVVNDDSSLSLDGGISLSKTTVKQRYHEGKSGLLDLSNESSSTQQVDSLGDILRLGDTLDELRNKALDILVDNQLADFLHDLVSMILDLPLGVPHGLGNNGDQLGNSVGQLCRSVLNKDFNAVKSGDLLGPLLGGQDGVDEMRQGSLNGVRADGLNDGQSGGNRGILDTSDLVTNSAQDERKKNDEVRLDIGGDLGVRGNILDGDGSLLASEGILLVGDLLLQTLNSPVRVIC